MLSRTTRLSSAVDTLDYNILSIRLNDIDIHGKITVG